MALIAAIILDKGSAPHKWHAAIILGTVGAFLCVLDIWTKVAKLIAILEFLDGMLSSPCVRYVADLRATIAATNFGYVLSKPPLAFIEAIFLIGIFSKLERRRASVHSGHASE